MTGQDYSVSISANIRAEEASERINRVADWWTASFAGASEKIGDTFSVQCAGRQDREEGDRSFF